MANPGRRCHSPDPGHYLHKKTQSAVRLVAVGTNGARNESVCIYRDSTGKWWAHDLTRWWDDFEQEPDFNADE